MYLFAAIAQAETSKPHFVAKPSNKSVLGKAAESSKVPVGVNAAQEAKQSDRVYHYRTADGGLAFSDRAPQQGHYQVLLFDCYACSPKSNVNWSSIPLFTTLYQQQIATAAQRYQLDPALIRAVIHAESAFKPAAISKVGAQGLMQLMPATAKELGVNDAFHPTENILAGSRYLATLLDRFDGDIALACAAYNAGASRVEQYKGIPPYPETQAYVERVQILLKRYRKA